MSSKSLYTAGQSLLLLGSLTLLHCRFIDGISEEISARVCGDSTKYSKNYSGNAFQKIKEGMPEDEVLRLLGPPIEEEWAYQPSKTGGREPSIAFSGEIVSAIFVHDAADNSIAKAQVGWSKDQVLAAFGRPARKRLFFSRNVGKASYRIRLVELVDNIVETRVSSFYCD